jgi:small subunit ribosomal protein S8
MDNIANMLTIIRNAVAVEHASVKAPYSKVNLGICEVLKNEGFIKDFEVKTRGAKNWLIVNLKYDKTGNSVITGIDRVSTPGKRKYIKNGEIFRVKQGYGLAILSTSLGIMKGEEARKNKAGGELLCKIW